MPYKQQTRFNKSVLFFIATLALIVLILALPLPQTVKIVGVLLCIAGFVFIRRGYIYFAQGATFLRSGEDEKAMKKFRASVKAGVGAEQKVGIGTVFIQKGFVDEGVSVLKNVLAGKTSVQDSNRARIALSMGLWMQNDIDSAIRILEDVRTSGYSDSNLYVNLTTYLLAAGRTERAKQIIAEAVKKEVKVPGLDDNRGWLDILTGHWARAAEIYDSLINEECVVFPEAYLHGAQVAVHRKDYESAMTYLAWGISKFFPATCTVTKEYMEQLLRGLGDTGIRKTFAEAMDANSALVASGKPFDGFEKAPDGSGPDFEAPQQVRREPAVSKVSKNGKASGRVDDDDERMPDTELNEKDFEDD